MLTLMYITNRPEVAKIAEKAGVDLIFIDLEVIGKAERQGGMDTVQSHHTIADAAKVKSVLEKAKMLVRCNPLHEGSRDEIDAIVNAGADIIMLPYFHTVGQARDFIDMVGGRARTCLLVETAGAAASIAGIANLDGLDMVHIGLNDLHLSLERKFMFELLADGTVEMLGGVLNRAGIEWGFGGIARLGAGALPAEAIIAEHYRLGSKMAIVSRSFCNTDVVTDLDEVRSIFDKGINDIRQLEHELQQRDNDFFEQNRCSVMRSVDTIVRKITK